MDPRTSRRSFLSLAAMAPLAASLASCGSAEPGTGGAGGGSGGAGAASMWILTAQPAEGIREATVDRFNEANPETTIDTTAFQNDAYKTKIRTAMGAGEAPTLIWGWGGGSLRTYAEAGQVEDLTSFFSDNPAVQDKLFASSFGAGTIDGTVYAMPCETVQPIVLYYNNELFEQIGAQPPQSWGDILDLVPAFNAQGIAPFSLGGQSRWTNMMWLEFLFDRIGGTEVFQAAFDGEAGAWSNPLALDALTKMQELIEADGFINGFQSITADSEADQALLYTGKAAMMLHGSWTYGSMSANGGDFVSSGKLGYMNFPPVDGGTGDPTSTVGNPGQYLSISSQASDEQKEIARNFLSTALLDETEVQQWIDAGSVPVVNGIDEQLASAENAEWLKFIYETASGASAFAQSWDQALSPGAAETLLTNIEQLFGLSISPQQFADNMNETIGQ